MFSTNAPGGISDELIGLDWAHRREMREVTEQAQSIVDRQDRHIIALQRQLSATRGQLATAQRNNDAMILDRGRARNEQILRRIMRKN